MFRSPIRSLVLCVRGPLLEQCVMVLDGILKTDPSWGAWRSLRPDESLNANSPAVIVGVMNEPTYVGGEPTLVLTGMVLATLSNGREKGVCTGSWTLDFRDLMTRSLAPFVKSVPSHEDLLCCLLASNVRFAVELRGAPGLRNRVLVVLQEDASLSPLGSSTGNADRLLFVPSSPLFAYCSLAELTATSSTTCTLNLCSSTASSIFQLMHCLLSKLPENTTLRHRSKEEVPVDEVVLMQAAMETLNQELVLCSKRTSDRSELSTAQKVTDEALNKLLCYQKSRPLF